MNLSIGSVLSSKLNRVKITVEDFSFQACSSLLCNSSNDLHNCRFVKTLPINIPTNSFEIVGDLFLHIRNYSSYVMEGILVIYNPAKYSISECKFDGVCTKNANENRQQDELQKLPIPRTKNNQHISPDTKLELFKFYKFSKPKRVEMCLEVEEELQHDTKNTKLESFVFSISEEALAQFGDDKNFKIICNGEYFYFNKTLLSLVSEVFQKMLQGNSKEAQENCVEISDFSPDTIRTFEKFSFSSEKIKPEEITVELLMFANKYFMKPLETKCKNYFVSILNKNNLLDFIKAAYDIDDEEMLKVGANYFSKYKKEMKGIEELKKFKKSNPDCMVRIYDIIFDE